MASMQFTKDGRVWRIGSTDDIDWLTGRKVPISSINTAIPPVFEAYGTFYPPDGVETPTHERVIVQELVQHTSEQPWWLGYLDTGAHDVVFPGASKVSLYWDWSYVLVEAGPDQALTWRTGHMRDGIGSLPDLFFPADRSWLVSALWDDTWTCLGGPRALINALQSNPLANARRVDAGQDDLPPGLVRE